MAGFTLLIADSDENFRRALSQQLQDVFYIRTCATAGQALELLHHMPIHVMVLDLMLPDRNGLDLLEELTLEGICPEVLMVAPVIPPQAAGILEELDICGFMRKPCSLRSAAEQLRRQRRKLEGQNLFQRRARQFLRQLYILPKYDGYSYLLHALAALAEDPRLTITKHLYPEIAKDLNCTAEQAERSIRNAIEKAWERHPVPWERFFPGYPERPTNGDFLQIIALEMRKNLE